ncbi:MAG: FeoB-associated Cys-rich membrane protein [Oscillospiraceae bacterium]|jgi:hypothetical protein
MIAFLTENLGTIIISLVLLAVVALIIANMARKRKRGQSAGCGCGCSGCPSATMCHKD